MTDLVDVDLDALAPRPKRVQLGGKVYKLPGDMPMPLFMRLQAFEQRMEKGESEVAMLDELQEELLGLFQEHQPKMTALPKMGVRQLLLSIGTIYGGGPGEAPAATPATRPPKKKTPSRPGKPVKRRAATSS